MPQALVPLTLVYGPPIALVLGLAALLLRREPLLPLPVRIPAAVVLVTVVAVLVATVVHNAEWM